MALFHSVLLTAGSGGADTSASPFSVQKRAYAFFRAAMGAFRERGTVDEMAISLLTVGGRARAAPSGANARKYRWSRLGFQKPVGFKKNVADKGRMRIGRAYIECYIGHEQKMNAIDRRGGGNEGEYLGGESPTRQGCPAAMAIAGSRAERDSQAISAQFRERRWEMGKPMETWGRKATGTKALWHMRQFRCLCPIKGHTGRGCLAGAAMSAWPLIIKGKPSETAGRKTRGLKRAPGHASQRRPRQPGH